jgi:glutathione S-transferase
MTITLYDLAAADPSVRFSPYCWRTRFALLHKGLGFETVPWRFTQKQALAQTGQGRVPVIVDHDRGDRWVNDSWDIAEYLDASYSDLPALMPAAADRAAAKFVATWADGALHMAAFPLILMNLFANVDEGDKAYFRESREQRLGRTLEEIGVAPDKGKEAFARALTPVEQALSVAPFLGGDAPTYADYVVAGSLMWVWVTAPVVPLDPSSAVGRWFAGMRTLFDGAANKAPVMR